MLIQGPDNQKEIIYAKACLAHELFPDQPLPETPSDLNWDELYRLLLKQGLAGHFYALKSTFQPHWPAAFCEKLRFAYYEYFAAGAMFNDKIKNILSTLRAAGIEVIVLKGWAVIQTIYGGDYSQRYFADIDLLIRQKDIEIVDRILVSLNYMGTDETWPGYNSRFKNFRQYNFQPYPQYAGRGFPVGLHWGLFHLPAHDPRLINIEELFECAHSIQVAGVDVLELSVSDQIVYGCAHLGLHHHKEATIYRYFEIALLLQRVRPKLNWEQLLNQASAWRCVLPMRHVLLHIESLWPGFLETRELDALAGVKPRRVEFFTMKWIENADERELPLVILYWLIMPGVKLRILMLLQDIFPSPGYMQKRYGPAPGGIWPMLYLRRYFRALTSLFKKSV